MVLMYVSWLFWLGLALPGYVVVRRLWPGDLASGLPGVLCMSFLAAFALLSPVSIVCYAFHLPLLVFSATCVLAMLAAAVEITRRGWWRDVGKLLMTGVTLECALIGLDMILGARVGGYIGAGDSRLHLARIRSLVDLGFQNFDPFIAGDYFFPIYHTNLLHALYAAGAQLTGCDHLGVWYASLPVAKLLVACGVYFMTWCAFENRWAAGLAAVFFLTTQAWIEFLMYPNKLAPFWLTGCMFGAAVQVCRVPSWAGCGKLAAGSLVLGQVHGLYGLFALMTLGPVLAVAVVVRYLHRRRVDARQRGSGMGSLRPAGCAVLALLAAMPFLVVSHAYSNPRDSGDGESGRVARKDPKRNAFRELDNGWVVKKARWGFGGADYVWLLAGTACAFVAGRRREALVILGALGSIAAYYYIPPLCTAVLEVFGRRWILMRMDILFRVAFACLVPGAVAFVVQRYAAQWWVKALLTLAAVAIAVPYSEKTEELGTYVRKAAATAEKRHYRLRLWRRARAFFDQTIPEGETILCTQGIGMQIVMTHGCHIIAPRGGSMGVPDVGLRKRHLKVIFDPQTSWRRRIELLNKYGVRHVVLTKKQGTWPEQMVERKVEWSRYQVFVLKTG